MARPPARKTGQSLKPFTVCDGHIMTDFENVRKHAGEQIMLTQDQAKFYQKTGCITFDMGAVFDEPSTDDKPKASFGTPVDRGGKPLVRDDDGAKAKKI